MVKPLGPYSLVRKAGNFYFISGVIPMNFETGEIVKNDDKQSFKQALDNLVKVLSEFSLSLKDVIKVTVFIKSKNVQLFNEIYAEYFKDNLPARSLVFVENLPMNANVEIEAICYKET
ncbi:MAG: Rid family hydrolase [Thermoproteota archaeon]|jgi:endoribonuclease L-PSP